MATITVVGRPAILNYTGNMIKYQLVCGSFALSDRLQMQILDSSSNVICTNEYPISDITSTIISPTFESILDAYFANVFLPNPTSGIANQEVILPSYLQSFSMRYRRVEAGVAPGAWTDDGYTHFAAKGGVGHMFPAATINFNADYNVTNGTWFPFTGGIADTDGHFMTNAFRGKRNMHYQERAWLLYLSQYPYAQRVEYYIEYKDGTNATIVNNLNPPGSSPWEEAAWWVPYGIEQCGLDPAGKGVTRYVVSIYTDVPILTEITFVVIDADYRMNYRPIDLYYRNSLGGLDHIRTRGDWSQTTKSTSADFQKRATPNNFSELWDGTNPFFTADLRPGWTVNTGFILKEAAIALQELLLRKGAWIVLNNLFTPVRIVSDELKVIDTKDNLYNLQFSFELSGSLNNLPANLSL